MSKFFVALIFHSLLSNCFCGTETQGTENGNVRIPDSIADPTFTPLILIVKNRDTSSLFDVFTSANEARGVPFSKIHMVDEEGHPLQKDEEKIYLCPRPSLSEELRAGDCKSIQFYEFETRFDKGESRRCTRPPLPVIVPRNRDMKSCDVQHSMRFSVVAIPFVIPVITNPDGEYCYRKGIKQFIDDVLNIKGLTARFETQFIELFQVCYDEMEKRTEWTIRWMKPSPLHLRQHVLQKVPYFSFDGTDVTQQEFDDITKAFNDQDKNKPIMIPHTLVPTEENTTHVWNYVTSHVVNLAPLWDILKPLIDLVDERLQRFCNRISRPIKVMTKSFYQTQTGKNPEKKYVGGNPHLMIPNIWAIQAYDEKMESAITIVLHNTPDELPQPGELCHKQDELVSCEFKKWRDISPSFRSAINDGLAQHAYCCKTTKFPMIDDINIVDVIDINFDQRPENHGDTPNGRW